MEQAKEDKFFITEILNDLYKNGFIPQGKAETMLKDWATELRERTRPVMSASKLKKTFAKEVGIKNR